MSKNLFRGAVCFRERSNDMIATGELDACGASDFHSVVVCTLFWFDRQFRGPMGSPASARDSYILVVAAALELETESRKPSGHLYQLLRDNSNFLPPKLL